MLIIWPNTVDLRAKNGPNQIFDLNTSFERSLSKLSENQLKLDQWCWKMFNHHPFNQWINGSVQLQFRVFNFNDFQSIQTDLSNVRKPTPTRTHCSVTVVAAHPHTTSTHLSCIMYLHFSAYTISSSVALGGSSKWNVHQGQGTYSTCTLVWCVWCGVVWCVCVELVGGLGYLLSSPVSSSTGVAKCRYPINSVLTKRWSVK